MDKVKAAADIVACALPLVPFEGWTLAVLQKAALDAGYKKTDAIRVFPGGAMDAIEAFSHHTDSCMEQELSRYHLETMKIRERIALAVKIRILIHENHKEALRKALALQAMPFQLHRGLKLLYDTVDAIWHAVGDTSTDFNFYTKRLMLAGVYTTTLRTWLDDKSPGFINSWAFLDRRIEDVMKIEKAKYAVKRWLNATP